jgi:hypothetical protein
MKQSLRLILIGGTAAACCAIPNLASAQPVPPQPPAGPIATPPPTPPGAPAYDTQQLPDTRGIVQRFTLTPRGELDGFLLTDGTEVHLPPHLSDRLATAVRPGDPVSIRGYRSLTAPLIVATAVPTPRPIRWSSTKVHRLRASARRRFRRVSHLPEHNKRHSTAGFSLRSMVPLAISMGPSSTTARSSACRRARPINLQFADAGADGRRARLGSRHVLRTGR